MIAILTCVLKLFRMYWRTHDMLSELQIHLFIIRWWVRFLFYHIPINLTCVFPNECRSFRICACSSIKTICTSPEFGRALTENWTFLPRKSTMQTHTWATMVTGELLRTQLNQKKLFSPYSTYRLYTNGFPAHQRDCPRRPHGLSSPLYPKPKIQQQQQKIRITSTQQTKINPLSLLARGILSLQSLLICYFYFPLWVVTTLRNQLGNHQHHHYHGWTKN